MAYARIKKKKYKPNFGEETLTDLVSPPPQAPPQFGGQVYTPPPQPLPEDPQYDNTVAGAWSTLATDVAKYGNASLLNDPNATFGQRYGAEGLRLDNEYGYVDTSNPYNRAKLLQKAYDEGQRYSQNSMASRGQLYSGALQRARDEGTFQYGRNQDTMRRQYDEGLRGINDRSAAAVARYHDTVNRAQGDRIADAPAATTATPAPPTAAQLGQWTTPTGATTKVLTEPGYKRNQAPKKLHYTYQRPKPKKRRKNAGWSNA